MSNFAKCWVSGTLRLALMLAVLVPVDACQDHDPLAPIPSRRGITKPNKTLSDVQAFGGVLDVNGAGEALGYDFAADGTRIALHVDGGAYRLEPQDSAEFSSSNPPEAINDAGQVIGNSWPTSAWLWTPDSPNATRGTWQRLPDPPSGPATATNLNDAGQIVGANSHIVVWTGGSVLELPDPLAGGTATPTSINDYGQIAGNVHDANGTSHVFLWTPSVPNGSTGNYLLLDAAGAAGGSTGDPNGTGGLNDFGQVEVNGADGVARIWTPMSPNGTTGVFTVIAGPYSALSAVAINNHGDVLLNGAGPAMMRCVTQHPYIWHPATPNVARGRLIDVTPGLGGFDTSPCDAWGNVLGEEESSSVELFGSNDWGDDQTWLVTELDAPLAAKIGWLAQHGPVQEGILLWFYGGNSEPTSVFLDYHWDFGDGTTGTGSSLTHAFPDNGLFTVRLTVSDGTGASSSTSIVVDVPNVAPTGTFSVSPTPPTEGGSYVLTIGNVSDVSGDLPTVQAALDCGDGRGLQSVGTGAAGGSLTCSAPNDGQRTIRAQLRDKDGGVTDYTGAVWIQNIAPAVTILSAPTSISEQATYTISFKFTDPGALDRWSYTVNWGDGTSSTPVSVSTQGGTITATHRFSVVRRGGARSSTYVVTVSVSDDGGAVGSASSSVMVSAK